MIVTIKITEPSTGTEVKTEQDLANGPHIQVMRLGRNTEGRYGSVVADNTGIEVIDSNDNRLEVIVSNNSANVVFIGFDSSVTENSGIRLNPYGGAFSTVNYAGPIYAWASDSSDVSYAEIGPAAA